MNRIEDQAAVLGLYACSTARTCTYMHTRTHPRLHLPGELVDDDRQKASYDIDSGGYSMILTKCTYNPTVSHRKNADKLCKLDFLIEGGIIIKVLCIKQRQII